MYLDTDEKAWATLVQALSDTGQTYKTFPGFMPARRRTASAPPKSKPKEAAKIITANKDTEAYFWAS